MAKARRVFVCRECGAQFPSWSGRCGRCEAWASIGEAAEVVHRVEQHARAGGAAPSAVPLGSVDRELVLPFPVGVDEVDRVLGGGLTPGSVTLLAGEPGVGKSTLTLQIAASVAAAGGSVVVVAGEEAPAQVATRASRLGPIPDPLAVIDDVTVPGVEAVIATGPQLVIVDSIQTLTIPELDSAPGSITQVRAAAARLTEAAKTNAVSVLLIGHVTKEGSIAGPRVLEHVVDTVLTFDGERHGDLRFLRAVKHRFGPTNEVGVFEMAAEGLVTVDDPSQRFLQDRQVGVAGSVVVPVLDGRRPILAEVQALVVPAATATGSTVSQGVNGRRVSLVRAVLTGRAGYRLGSHDVFVSATGGLSIEEPAADLAVAVALASAVENHPTAADVVVCGEIGLGGELRSVPRLEHRLQEAFRMGFRTAVVPASAGPGPTGLRMIRATNLGDALARIPHEVGAP